MLTSNILKMIDQERIQVSVVDILSLGEPVEGSEGILYVNVGRELEQVDPSKPTIINISAASGTGKDSTISVLSGSSDEISIDKPVASLLKTGTSRKRRTRDNTDEEIEEPEDAYTFFRQPYAHEIPAGWSYDEKIGKFIRPEHDESFPLLYMQAIQDKYDLLEINYYSGAVYGLPRANLAEALEKDGKTVPMIRTTIDKINDLRDDERISNAVNIICIFLIPNTFQELADRLQKTRRDGFEERIIEAWQEIFEYSPGVANYYIVNGEGELDKTVKVLERFCLDLIRDHQLTKETSL